jgi:hypothetical protein
VHKTGKIFDGNENPLFFDFFKKIKIVMYSGTSLNEERKFVL